MVTRHIFDQELEHLHMEMITMASLVEGSIEKIITALKQQDIDIAKTIIEEDDLIDDMEAKIEQHCFTLIARQQPMAKDLRTINAALKIITDLERIADHSSDIAELCIKMAEEKYIKPLIDIPKMAELASQMVRQAIDSYTRHDIQLATKVCKDDDAVDDLMHKIILELNCIMKQTPETVDQAINFIFIAKYLERMGDHATNICEWTFYAATGEHKKLARHEEKHIRK